MFITINTVYLYKTIGNNPDNFKKIEIMTALEISTKNYNRFEDKKDITALNNALLCIQSDYAKRDSEGNKVGGFEQGVLEAAAQKMRIEFVANKRCSKEIREFCVEIMKEMKY